MYIGLNSTNQSDILYDVLKKEERMKDMKESVNITELFGSLVFNDRVMKARLSDEV